MIGCLIAIYGLVPNRDTKEVLKMMDDGIKDTGIIMLITGVGGSLGYVVRASGIGTVLGQMVVFLADPRGTDSLLHRRSHADLPGICNGCHRNLCFPDHAADGAADHQPAAYGAVLLRRVPSPSGTSLTPGSGSGMGCSVSAT